MLFAFIMLALLAAGAYANGRKSAFEEIEREVICHEIGEMEKLRKNLAEQNRVNEQVRKTLGI